MLAVSHSGKTILILLLLGLAGCASHPQKDSARSLDWRETGTPSATVDSNLRKPEPSLSAPREPGAPLAPAAPVAAPAVFQGPWIGLDSWSKAYHLDSPTMISPTPSPTFALRSANGVLTLRPGSQMAYWDGLALHLGFAPHLIKAHPYLHTLDLQKTVLPLFDGSPGVVLGSRPVIVLDPGHGGEDSGTRSVVANRYEKEFTLDWARRLQTLLSTKGCDVFLTRSNDFDLSLSNRVTFAAEHKADLFLSLHFNSAGGAQNETGLETYCLTPAGMPSNLTRGFADDLRIAFPNNAFDAQNLQLALRVHRELLQVNGHRDRGVRRARFPTVLRGQQRPAVLIEGGYLSNPREAQLIADPAYRQKLAEAVARALLAQMPKNEKARATAQVDGAHPATGWVTAKD
jgi:N-acetylmuramoyl-L-alanine amidase